MRAREADSFCNIPCMDLAKNIVNIIPAKVNRIPASQNGWMCAREIRVAMNDKLQMAAKMTP